MGYGHGRENRMDKSLLSRSALVNLTLSSWQDEALARDGVSREVHCSALKGETVPDSLPATPKIPPSGTGSPALGLCSP